MIRLKYWLNEVGWSLTVKDEFEIIIKSPNTDLKYKFEKYGLD